MLLSLSKQSTLGYGNSLLNVSDSRVERETENCGHNKMFFFPFSIHTTFEPRMIIDEQKIDDVAREEEDGFLKRVTLAPITSLSL